MDPVSLFLMVSKMLFQQFDEIPFRFVQIGVFFVNGVDFPMDGLGGAPVAIVLPVFPQDGPGPAGDDGESQTAGCQLGGGNAAFLLQEDVGGDVGFLEQPVDFGVDGMGFFDPDERHVREFFQIHNALFLIQEHVGRKGIFSGHQDQVFRINEFRFQVGRKIFFVARNHNEGHFVVPQQAEQFGGAGFLDVEGRTREFPAELGQYGREHIAGTLRRDPQADGSVGAVLQVGQMILEVAFVPQKLPGYSDIVLAGVSKDQGLFGTVEQLQADFLFNFCQGIAQGRLRNIELFGRIGDAAAVRNGDHILEFPKIHEKPPSVYDPSKGRAFYKKRCFK